MLHSVSRNADIIMVTETWVAASAQAQDLSGYVCFSAARPSRGHAGRHSGGLACYVRQPLAGFVSVHKAAPDASLLWLRLDKGLGLHCDLYLCVVYAAPHTSTHHDSAHAVDVYEQLQQEIADVQELGDVLLAGDFNARTGQGADFVDAALVAASPEGALPLPQLPTGLRPRRSCDQGAINLFGRQLLALCSSTGMLLLNGRVPGDEHGQLTFPYLRNGATGGSLIDYFVASPALFSLQPTLHVAPLAVESDHCPLLLTLHRPAAPTPPAPTPPPAQRILKYRHHPAHTDDYCLTLATLLNRDAAQAASDPGTWLQNCIAEAARSTHGLQGNRETTPFHAPWFDAECKTARRLLHARPLAQRTRAEIHTYKASVRRKKRLWRRACNEECCKLAATDAGRFWRKFRTRAPAPAGISLQDWHDAFSSLLASVEPATQGPAPDLPPSTEAAFPELHGPVTQIEVQAAIKRLRRNKASGVDGIRAEHLLDASELLLEPMARTFTHLLQNGVPKSWCRGVIHPVFKSGQRDDPSNYRGITVTPVLSKLFAMVIEARLTSWAEDNHMRARGQAGFRKGHRTVDHVFTLLHLTKQRAGKRLYCCFVDFRKAFDSIPRERLWQVLANKGLAGPLLSCLRSMYAQDDACVTTAEGRTDFFACTAGVRQGCPASPLLFGLYLDELETQMTGQGQALQGDSPSLGGTAIPLLLFADDLVLVSLSERGLQSKLSTLQTFCESRGLTVNLAKTKAVVFNQRTARTNLQFAGQAVEQVDRYKYLGIVLHQNGKLTCASDTLRLAGERAAFALRSRCTQLGITDPRLKCNLFDALVRPVLSFGCEVWAPLPGKGALRELESVHLSFLRSITGLPRTAPNKLVYAESGRMPLEAFWVKQYLHYLKYLHELEPTRLPGLAYLHGRAQGLGWREHVEERLTSLGVTLPASGQRFDPSAAIRAHTAAAESATMAPSPSSHLEGIYFAHKRSPGMEAYLYRLQNRALRVTMAHFRTGQHWLQIRLGRFAKVPYEQRFCLHCAQQQQSHVDTEEHMIFSCPKYQAIRAQSEFAEGGLWEASDLQSFLQQPPGLVAKFLHACYQHHLASV